MQPECPAAVKDAPGNSYQQDGFVLLESQCTQCISQVENFLDIYIYIYIRADSKLAPSQWEMSLQSNAISHWLGTNLESALYMKLIQSMYLYYM